MIKQDEDALICDLAETYRIYDYRQLPLLQVAVFAYGLRDHLTKKEEKDEKDYLVFKSGEDFEKYREKLLTKMGGEE